MRRDNFKRKGAAYCKVLGSSTVSCAKMAEQIEMSFGTWTLVGPRKHVLDEGAHWRNPANTTEESMCGGDVAFSKLLWPLVIIIIVIIIIIPILYLYRTFSKGSIAIIIMLICYTTDHTREWLVELKTTKFWRLCYDISGHSRHPMTSFTSCYRHPRYGTQLLRPVMVAVSIASALHLSRLAFKVHDRGY